MEKPSIKHCHFIAFYAYKGGIGRTLALANCARALAARGKRVLVIDLDLDTPGLDHFPAFKPANPHAQETSLLRGIAEYLHIGQHQGAPKSLQAYTHRCQAQQGDKGELWIMPAGRYGEAYYLEILNTLNKNYNQPGEQYERLIKQLRRQIVDEIRPDYVLIDSRTGFSELGNGIATHLLANVTVLVTDLHAQNIDGIQRMYHSLSQHPFMPTMMLMFSPLPSMNTGANSPFQRRMSWIQKHLPKIHNVKIPAMIPYQPLLAIDNRILVDENDNSLQLASPYYRLVRQIQEVVQDLDIFLERASSCWREGRLEEAETALSNGLRQNPQHTHLLQQRARLRLDMAINGIKNWDPALEDLSHLAQLKPNDARSWINLGIALGQANRLSDAIAAHRKATQLTPKSAKAWDNLGIALGRSGLYSEAIEAHRKATEYNKTDYKAWYNLGVALMESGRHSAAADAYIKVINLQPNDAIIWYKLGNALRHIRRYNESINAYRTGLKLQPNNQRFWDSMGITLGHAKRFKEAITAHRRALKIKPKEANIWHNLGVALAEDNRHNEALEAYREALTLKNQTDEQPLPIQTVKEADSA